MPRRAKWRLLFSLFGKREVALQFLLSVVVDGLDVRDFGVDLVPRVDQRSGAARQSVLGLLAQLLRLDPVSAADHDDAGGLGLIAENIARREKDKSDDGRDDDIVLPAGARKIPEEKTLQ